MISTIRLTINSGFQHSDVAGLRQERGSVMTLVANALTSCQLFLQVGTSINSSDLKRVDLMAPPSSNWVWSVGAGDRAIPLPAVGPFLRIETSVLQSDNRSLGLVVGGV